MEKIDEILDRRYVHRDVVRQELMGLIDSGVIGEQFTLDSAARCSGDAERLRLQGRVNFLSASSVKFCIDVEIWLPFKFPRTNPLLAFKMSPINCELLTTDGCRQMFMNTPFLKDLPWSEQSTLQSLINELPTFIARLIDTAIPNQMSCAARYGAKSFLKQLVDMDGVFSDPALLMEAVLSEDTAMVNLVIELGVSFLTPRNVTVYFSSAALLLASYHGMVEIVELLLDLGEDPNVVNHRNPILNSSLYFAADGGHTSVVRLLLQRGCVLHIEKAIEIASKRGHHETLAVLELAKEQFG